MGNIDNLTLDELEWIQICEEDMERRCIVYTEAHTVQLYRLFLQGQSPRQAVKIVFGAFHDLR